MSRSATGLDGVFGHQDAEGRADAIAPIGLDERGERCLMCGVQCGLSTGLGRLERDTRRPQTFERCRKVRIGPGAVHVEHVRGVSPALDASSSSLPGSDKAKGPEALAGIGGKSGFSAATIAVTSILPGSPQVMMNTLPPGLVTRRASRRAATGSAANWNALNPVTTSKLSSSNGRISRSPRSRRAPGRRSRATSSNPADASIPATSAPRSAASCIAIPAPQPTSSKRVFEPTGSLSNTAWYPAAHCGSWIKAQSVARAPQIWPLASPLRRRVCDPAVSIIVIVSSPSLGLGKGKPLLSAPKDGTADRFPPGIKFRVSGLYSSVAPRVGGSRLTARKEINIQTLIKSAHVRTILSVGHGTTIRCRIISVQRNDFRPA